MKVLKGYQPNKGKLDELNPPKGGSGISICNNMKEVEILLKSPSDIDRIFLKTSKNTKILVIKC